MIHSFVVKTKISDKISIFTETSIQIMMMWHLLDPVPGFLMSGKQI